MSNINLKLKKYTKHSILSYEYNDTLFRYNYIWKKIAKINKNISTNLQYQLIKKNEKEYNKILGSKRIKKNLLELDNYNIIEENKIFYFLM